MKTANTINTKTTNSKLTSAILLALGLTLSLSACNVQLNVDGETVADFDVTKTGIISNLDNDMTVNGTSYDTNNATVIVDGVETDVSSLKEGMLVTVTGTESADGTANARTISFTDDVEGMVLSSSVDASGTRVLNVLGQTVLIDANTIFESNDINDISTDDIDIGNIVEVSGYSNGNGEIQATRVEVKSAQYDAGEKMELKGNISNLTNTTFNIGQLTINVENAVLDNDFMGTLQNGQYVEVSSYENLDANGYFVANEIELKNNGTKEVRHDNNDEKVEIKGAITAELVNGQLEINGSKVILDNNTVFDEVFNNQLTQGTIIEAEGYINVDGVFVATELELENDSDSDTDSKSVSGIEDDDGDNNSNEANEHEDHD